MRKQPMRLFVTAALSLLLSCSVSLAASKNLLAGAVWQYSVDEGKTWANSANVPEAGTATLRAKTTFSIDDPAAFASFTLTHALAPGAHLQIQLNGQEIAPAMKGMRYKSYAGIPASFAKKGANELTLTLEIPAKAKAAVRQVEAKCDLVGLSPDDLKIQTGPILGAFGNDYFTVTCRTNMPAKVSVVCVGKPVTPESTGMYHRLRVKRPAGEGEYELLAQCQSKSVRIKLTPQPPVAADKLTFVAAGDCRSVLRDWKLVAAALGKVTAQVLFFNGDFVEDGLQDWTWDPEFFGPIQPAVSHMPIYAVMGNHEHGSEIVHQLFYTPSDSGQDENWSQQIGPGFFVGINGERNFSKDSDNAKWLEAQFQSAGKAKFIFVFSHYPAWSSGGHGQREAKDGLSDTAKWARETIEPLMQKYKVTAFIVGHDHDYERSELPGGLIEITTGGAGAPTVPFLSSDLSVNPYSKAYSSKLHYCLFDLDGDTWTMKAITPEGKVIDECGGKARE